MPYRCSYCGNPHCDDHRLPEAHMCPEKHKADAARRQRELTGDPGIEIQNKPGRGQTVRGSGWDRDLGGVEGNVALYLLGAIVVVFILELIVQQTWGPGAFSALFVLDAAFLSKPWTIITSIFAHGSFNHLLFNGIVLFFFGPLLEKRIGSRRFLALVLASGAIAGLAQVGLTVSLGERGGVIGISGALMGIMGALTLLGPRLTVLIFFIIPAPLWALTIGYAALDTLGLFYSTGNVAHMAHLAGLAIGLFVGYRLREQGFKFPGQSGHMRPRRQAGFGGGGGGW